MFKVIDGDTLDTPLGRVRLYGVDTPEHGEPCFDESTDRLKDLVGAIMRIGTGPRSKDPFGRLLYYGFTEGGESIDEILVKEGLGLAWRVDGQHKDVLMSMELDARELSTGCLWT